MNSSLTVAAVVLGLCAAPSALADGETAEAELQYPGLSISGSKAVSVESVAVRLGGNAEQSEVTYVLLNSGDALATVEARWAFPSARYSPVRGVAETDSFRLSIEGGIIRPHRVVRAVVGDAPSTKDVTQLLRECSVSIEDFGGRRRTRLVSPDGGVLEDDSELGGLSAKCRNDLASVGALDEGFPRWWSDVAYVWQQQVAPRGRTKIVLSFEQSGEDLPDAGSVGSRVSSSYKPADLERLARRSVSSGWLMSLVPVAHVDGQSAPGKLQVTAVGSSACRPILLRPRGAKWPSGARLEHSCERCSFGDPVMVVFACGQR